ncbi:MAG: DUF4340 domain-containing protein [Candidatus Zixiibacteriota bacterium]
MKRLTISILILVAILAIWIIQSNWEKNRISVKVTENFLNLDSEQIDKVAIYSQSDTIVVFNNNGYWFVEDTIPRKADNQVIGNMIDKSSEITVESIISQNPDRQAEFEVDSTGGIFVEFWGGEKLLGSVFVGKMTSGYTHTYIRKPNSKDVYLSTGPLSYIFNRPLTGWLDKNIISIQSGNIESVEFVYPNYTFKLIRQDSLWAISKPPYKNFEIADDLRVEPTINQIISLTATDFENASDSGLVNFNNPSLTLNISLLSGATETVTFGAINEEETRRYCRKKGVSETYVIMRSRLETVYKDYSDFIAPMGE